MGADRLVRWQMALPRRSRNEIGEPLRDAIRVDHATVCVLSDPMAAWVPAIDGPRRASRTASCNTTAANSRSELVPFGLASETTLFVMSLGHWTRQIFVGKVRNKPHAAGSECTGVAVPGVVEQLLQPRVR